MKLLLILFYFSFITEILAQNPDQEWVMLFQNELLAQEISVDGSRFAVLEQSHEGISDKIIFYFVSEKRKVIFKKIIITSDKVFKVTELFISIDADKIAVTGISSPVDYPNIIKPLTIMYDAKGKELWRTASNMIGFLDNGNSVLLINSVIGREAAPCYRDEKEGIDYSCLRVAESFSSELKELITFPGHLGGYGFVYIWDQRHVVIGSLEGSIYFKDIKDEIHWYIPGEELIVKSVFDKENEILVVERGGNDSVYDRNGVELWSGVLKPEGYRVKNMPEADIMIKFGEPILNKYQILFWKDDWQYKGMYKAQKDELNHIFHWDTFGQKFMRYSVIRYSQERKRAIARTMDRKKIDYYNFEIKKDPATANEP
ncbi:MAG: hypothetical protein IIB94_08720 [Candidatus Marinimicrobia bacterium]|nr:hypothetical protein [Candidatus Neomarinimicrobiota bacterium]